MNAASTPVLPIHNMQLNFDPRPHSRGGSRRNLGSKEPLIATRNCKQQSSESSINQAKLSRLAPDMDFSKQVDKVVTPRGALREVKEEPEEFYSVAREQKRASAKQLRSRGS